MVVVYDASTTRRRRERRRWAHSWLGAACRVVLALWGSVFGPARCARSVFTYRVLCAKRQDAWNGPPSRPTGTPAAERRHTPLDRTTGQAWTGRTAVGTRAVLPAAGFETGLRGVVEDRRPRVRLPRRAGHPPGPEPHRVAWGLEARRPARRATTRSSSDQDASATPARARSPSRRAICG